MVLNVLSGIVEEVNILMEKISLTSQEVNEGIQALSSSEEEKKGVAASLLAPLLPEVVKEEEERWRRKVICKEEVEPLMEEDVTAEQTTAISDHQLEGVHDIGEDPSQEDLCSVVQSGESAEEEEEQDTLELEMVLERKKVGYILWRNYFVKVVAS